MQFEFIKRSTFTSPQEPVQGQSPQDGEPELSRPKTQSLIALEREIAAILSKEGDRILETARKAVDQVQPEPKLEELAEKLRSSTNPDESRKEAFEAILKVFRHAPSPASNDRGEGNPAKQALAELKAGLPKVTKQGLTGSRKEFLTVANQAVQSGDLADLHTRMDRLSDRMSLEAAIAVAESKLATLGLVAQIFMNMQLAEFSSDWPQAYLDGRAIIMKLSDVLPDDHGLVQFAIERTDSFWDQVEIDVWYSKRDEVTAYHPILTATERGFEVRFVLPDEMVGPYVLPEPEIVIEYLMKLAAAAEVERSKEGDPNAQHYDSLSSTFSVFNRNGEKEARLYDPTGAYRGRVSSNSSGKESIINTSGSYGSDRQKGSIHHHLSGRGEATVLIAMLYGPWKLVADLA